MLIVHNPERPRPKSVNLHVHVLSGPTQVFESISMDSYEFFSLQKRCKKIILVLLIFCNQVKCKNTFNKFWENFTFH